MHFVNRLLNVIRFATCMLRSRAYDTIITHGWLTVFRIMINDISWVRYLRRCKYKCRGSDWSVCKYYAIVVTIDPFWISRFICVLATCHACVLATSHARVLTTSHARVFSRVPKILCTKLFLVEMVSIFVTSESVTSSDLGVVVFLHVLIRLLALYGKICIIIGP